VTDSVPAFVNNLGHVAGSCTGCTAGTFQAFLLTPSGLQDLGVPNISNGDGLNNLDQVIGVFNPDPNNLKFHAFLWTSGTGTQDLGTLGGAQSFAIGINDSAQVVGVSDIGDASAAFLWSDSTGMQNIGTFRPFAISNQGQVAAVSPAGHAILWTQSSGTQDLGVLPGSSYSEAVAINNRGVVVGNSGSIFLWSQAQGMLNVNTLCNNKQQNWKAVGINDAGQIVAAKKGGIALVLTPIMAVALSSSQNPSHLGQSVTFTATTSSIAGAPPDGETITFMDSTTMLGTAPLENGTATITISNLALGSHRIVASYPGDTNYAGRNSKVFTQIVKR
jgi:probable HAF family extracellular repeat protein